MKVLVIGSGGREHALVWKLSRSPLVKSIYSAPGNPGIGHHATLVPIDANDLNAMVSFARSEAIDLTIVGPEQPLADGIVDLFENANLTIFGPSRNAARLEWSKGFAKLFMEQNGIPTAAFRIFTESDMNEAKGYLQNSPLPVVLKADGLAAGKGVLVCNTREEVADGLRDIVERKVFGEAGDSLLVEEFLEGEEASVMAVCDGRDYVTLAPAQDYKRALDNDRGKNTGGMGSYAPAPVVTDDVLLRVRKEIIEPALGTLERDGSPYRGCLYVGLMITKDGPKVVEFNSRFGDPETQVILPLFDGDLADLLFSASTSRLAEWKKGSRGLTYSGAALCVILAAEGYPGKYEKGKKIVGVDTVAGAEDLMVFHAGTGLRENSLWTAGGRVIGVTAHAGDIAEARNKAYEAIKSVSFDGMFYRRDIGKRVVQSATMP